MMGEGVITPQYPQKIKFNIKCVTSRKEERNLNIPDVRLRYCVGSSSCVLVRVILACSSSHVRGRRRSLAWIFRDSVKKEFVCRREKIKEIEINFFFSFFDWLDLIGFDWTYLYPYSMLSPQPPQIHSWLRFLGRRAREQPQDESWPSRQAREIEWTTPAAAIEWANAASRLPIFHFFKIRIMSEELMIVIKPTNGK